MTCLKHSILEGSGAHPILRHMICDAEKCLICRIEYHLWRTFAEARA